MLKQLYVNLCKQIFKQPEMLLSLRIFIFYFFLHFQNFSLVPIQIANSSSFFFFYILRMKYMERTLKVKIGDCKGQFLSHY